MESFQKARSDCSSVQGAVSLWLAMTTRSTTWTNLNMVPCLALIFTVKHKRKRDLYLLLPSYAYFNLNLFSINTKELGNERDKISNYFQLNFDCLPLKTRKYRLWIRNVHGNSLESNLQEKEENPKFWKNFIAYFSKITL